MHQNIRKKMWQQLVHDSINSVFLTHIHFIVRTKLAHVGDEIAYQFSGLLTTSVELSSHFALLGSRNILLY